MKRCRRTLWFGSPRLQAWEEVTLQELSSYKSLFEKLDKAILGSTAASTSKKPTKFVLIDEASLLRADRFEELLHSLERLLQEPQGLKLLLVCHPDDVESEELKNLIKIAGGEKRITLEAFSPERVETLLSDTKMEEKYRDMLRTKSGGWRPLFQPIFEEHSTNVNLSPGTESVHQLRVNLLISKADDATASLIYDILTHEKKPGDLSRDEKRMLKRSGFVAVRNGKASIPPLVRFFLRNTKRMNYMHLESASPKKATSSRKTR
jgi:hypothetical protein